MANQLAKTGWLELLCWALKLRRRVVVSGRSMSPTSRAGDELLVATFKPPFLGGLVVFEHPRESGLILVKRVEAFSEDGSLWVAGDNIGESNDSRDFGLVDLGLVLGVPSSLLKSRGDRP
jgi:hypothetical protein